jgi:hypothetical protein
MMDMLDQPRKVYRYVMFKGILNSLPAIAVAMTALYGIWVGAIVLAFQIGLGAMTDLSFFSALTERAGMK